MKNKESVRSEWQAKLADLKHEHRGKTAEKLRSLQTYREAVTVFATPHDSLHQARINCLADGKDLLMPGPSIREGFFLLQARSTPFKNISVAVTYKGLEKFGQQLNEISIAQLSPGLLLTDSLAVDCDGGRIGDGYGYFDLCCALLHKLAGLNRDAEIITFIEEDQISRDSLPQDSWDVRLSRAITPTRILQFEPSGQEPQIFWDDIPHDRIKRINPLFKLYQKRGVKR
jgi:5-formyltetrahydrofolate cyclo-ligase